MQGGRVIFYVWRRYQRNTIPPDNHSSRMKLKSHSPKYYKYNTLIHPM